MPSSICSLFERRFSTIFHRWRTDGSSREVVLVNLSSPPILKNIKKQRRRGKVKSKNHNESHLAYAFIPSARERERERRRR
jgi:predicted NodU family carbamoyl transferase